MANPDAEDRSGVVGVPRETVYTGADALTDALLHLGVEYVFVNLGTDHPALVESWARRAREGEPLPRIITSPHETVALAAAMGYADVSGRMQAVVVHVDVGTQNLGGMVHNAARGRVPVLIIAGASSVTLHGEMAGSRSDFIQFVQDVYDQRGIVREYVKWSYEAKTGRVLGMLAGRAAQMANADPKGPVYLVAAREMLEEPADRAWSTASWARVEPAGLAPEAVRRIGDALLRARRPLVVTSYLGRQPAAVEALVRLSERLGLGVVQPQRRFLNFPDHHPHHLGYEAAALVRQADLVLVLDCDLPWVPMDAQPAPGASVFYLDVDPIKEAFPLWHLPIDAAYRVDTGVALEQLEAYLAGRTVDGERLEERRRWIAAEYDRIHVPPPADPIGPEGAIRPDFVTAEVNALLDPDDIVVNEMAPIQHLQRTRPGTYFSSGGSSLGWGGGAALGAKLAAPDRTVVHLSGDGAFIFGIPTAVYWMAKRYQAPFLTVVYDNGGWNAVRRSTLRQHPTGVAAATREFFHRFADPPQYHEIARAAGGALAIRVERPEALRDALKRGLEAVRSGTSAVVNVRVEAP
ncbi:MAG: thiamine pyrophosphate-requiring protein [Firmicutes bacterium]|nr:thiamine pyrophosphate-requiring protein [Alicyclobacillaceae bacterium]MCL6497741.1 thiamine pyrophosphate-requiring protein [Bacillota bacterium]